MEQFDSYHIEVYINNVWVDLTPDVLSRPGVRWNMGIMDNGSLDRVGDPERMSFSLKNGENNSSGLIGRYSPGHANALSGWDTGLPVRLRFAYDGSSTEYYKFRGVIEPEGIEVEPGTKASRRVHVKVHGYMSQATDHPLRLMTLQTNLRIDQAVPYIVSNMGISPVATDYRAGVDTFPTAFDTVSADSRATSEFQKLAVSEFGYIYTRGDRTGGQVLVVEGRNARQNTSNTRIPVSSTSSPAFLLKAGSSDKILKSNSSDRILLNETTEAEFDNTMLVRGTRIGYGRHLANQIKAVSYPRRIDAAATTVLWALRESFSIAAGETKSNYRGEYRDPNGGATYVNGKEMVTPVSGTDYAAFANADGTGTNLTANLTVVATYGTEAVEYDLTNTGGSTLWVTVLQARGKGIYIYDPVTVVYDDAASQAIHGVHSLTLDMKYQDDPTLVDAIAANTLSTEKSPVKTIDRMTFLANRNSNNMYGFLLLEPGTRAHFVEDMNAIDGDYYIMGYEAEIIPGADGPMVLWSPVLRDTSYGGDYALWDVDLWDVGVWGFPE